MAEVIKMNTPTSIYPRCSGTAKLSQAQTSSVRLKKAEWLTLNRGSKPLRYVVEQSHVGRGTISLEHQFRFHDFKGDLNVKQRSRFRKHFKVVESALKTMALTSHFHGSSGGSGLSLPPASPTLPFPVVCIVFGFIQSQAKTMKLSDIIRNRAIGIAQNFQIDELFYGRRPSSTAAIILSFAAGCDEYYIGNEPYAEAANVTVNTILNGQRKILKVVQDMVVKGPLPKLFRAGWYCANYRPHLED